MTSRTNRLKNQAYNTDNIVPIIMTDQVRFMASAYLNSTFYGCVTFHSAQVTNPFKDIVLSLTKLADRWFPEDVKLEKCYVVKEDVIEIFVDQAYYLLMTDESIPEELRMVYKMRELRHAGEVVSEHVHIIDQLGGEHLRKLMSSIPQLHIEMMVAYLTSAHYMEIVEDAGGMSPALWAKQLQLALPVLFHFQICSMLDFLHAYYHPCLAYYHSNLVRRCRLLRGACHRTHPSLCPERKYASSWPPSATQA